MSKITVEQIPATGPLAYGPITRAKALILRGGGELWYQGYLVMDHPHPEYVMVHREGGGLYATSGSSCNCTGHQIRGDCSHSQVVRAISDVQSIKQALQWYEETKEQ